MPFREPPPPQSNVTAICNAKCKSPQPQPVPAGHSPTKLCQPGPSFARHAWAGKESKPQPSPTQIHQGCKAEWKNPSATNQGRTGNFQDFSLPQGWVQGVQDKMLLLPQVQTSAITLPPLSSVLSQFSCNWFKALLQIKKKSPVYLETREEKEETQHYFNLILREEGMMICVSPSSYFLISLRNHSREQ